MSEREGRECSSTRAALRPIHRRRTAGREAVAPPDQRRDRFAPIGITEAAAERDSVRDPFVAEAVTWAPSRPVTPMRRLRPATGPALLVSCEGKALTRRPVGA